MGDKVTTNFVNKIFCGDCQKILRQYIPDNSVDLIYADPPFFTEKKYEVIWGDGYEIRAYEDRWKGGIQNYLAWMEPKLRECHRVLKPTGSLYLHCDYHANAYLKILLDRIFGEENFGDEIIWTTIAKHDRKITHLGRFHDTIFRYVKTNRAIWNTQHKALNEDYIEKVYKYTDKRGRYKRSDLSAASGGQTLIYKWKGHYPPKGRFWMFSKERMEELDRQGRIDYGKNGKPYLKTYLNESKGIPLQDVWMDIPPLSSADRERLGYPTQKPERLLERIINLSSNPMDIVLDPFCGCGTAIAVAHKLGRRWIGIDISPTACKLMFKRIQKLNPQLRFEETVIGMPKTIEEIRQLQPFEFQNWVIQKLGARASERKIGDMGIDGFTFDLRPIQVKQSDNIGRNVIDNFETAMRRVKAKKGIIIAFSFGKGAYEEVARAKLQEGLEIELMTVEELLKLA